jgi:hypothetical protein
VGNTDRDLDSLLGSHPRALLIVISTVLILIVAGTVAGLELTKQPPSTPKAAASTSVVTRVVAYHGIEIAVPASWGVNQAPCGVPITDTVVLNAAGYLDACKKRHAPSAAVSDVLLNEWSRGQGKPGSKVTHNGVTEYVDRLTAAGGPRINVVVPADNVMLSIHATVAAIAEQILDSIHAIARSPGGCSSPEGDYLPANIGTSGALRHPFHQRPGMSHALVPGSARSIQICAYEDNWFYDAITLTRTAVRQLVHTVNQARRAPIPSPPGGCAAPTPFGTLTARYSHGAAVTVWIDDVCGDDVITNGSFLGTAGHRLQHRLGVLAVNGEGSCLFARSDCTAEPAGVSLAP